MLFQIITPDRSIKLAEFDCLLYEVKYELSVRVPGFFDVLEESVDDTSWLVIDSEYRDLACVERKTAKDVWRDFYAGEVSYSQLCELLATKI